MTAYIIVDVEVIDAEGYAEYAKRVPETLEPFRRKISRARRPLRDAGERLAAEASHDAGVSVHGESESLMGFRDLRGAEGPAPAHGPRSYDRRAGGGMRVSSPARLPLPRGRC